MAAFLVVLLAPSVLAVSTLVRLPVQLEKSTLRVAARHLATAPPAGLAEFLGSQSPLSLARGLARNLPPGTLRVSAPEGGANMLMVEFDRRVNLGPAAWNLWMQPRIVVWLRTRGTSILAQGHLCGVGSSDETVRIPFLNLRSKFTAVEGPLSHLQGDSIPCLLLRTALKAEVEMCLAKGWKRWLPRALLLRLASRRLLAEFQRLQEAIAAGLIAEYDACRAEWLSRPPVARTRDSAVAE
jgi:hypothetical protein